MRAAGDQSRAPGLQMLCSANANLGWTRLLPNNSSDHFSTPSLQEFSAIDFISYFTWKNTSPGANLTQLPLSDKPCCFWRTLLIPREGAPPLYLSPLTPLTSAPLDLGAFTAFLLDPSLQLKTGSRRFHSICKTYGKHKTPFSTHFPPLVTTQTSSFPSQPYLKGLLVLPVFFLTFHPLLPSL